MNRTLYATALPLPDASSPEQTPEIREPLEVLQSFGLSFEKVIALKIFEFYRIIIIQPEPSAYMTAKNRGRNIEVSHRLVCQNAAGPAGIPQQDSGEGTQGHPLGVGVSGAVKVGCRCKESVLVFQKQIGGTRG